MNKQINGMSYFYLQQTMFLLFQNSNLCTHSCFCLLLLTSSSTGKVGRAFYLVDVALAARARW